MRTFVALDLELTPVAPDRQRIIEVAAARFTDGEPSGTFSSLVDPSCELTLRVGILTGIHQSQLDSAPSLASIVPQLVAFVGSDPIVGQSIEMDMEQLAASSVHLSNPVYDTFELATLLMPGLPTYDLASIARELGVQPEREHRALDDAVVAGRVFLALVQRASELSIPLLSRIDAIASNLPGWPLAELFKDVLRRRARTAFSAENGRPVLGKLPARPATSEEDDFVRAAPSPRSPLRPSPSPVAVEMDELRSLLRPEGEIGQSLAGFEEREEQLRMLEAVAGALNEGGHLLVEAGTGTGKSLAYLLPAVYYAARNGRPVVVSTNTINLQDQLFHKDLPALQACLPQPFKAALVKGRANYLCLRRWAALSRTPNMGPAEAMLVIRTLVWLSTTQTGDRAELNLAPPEAALWPRISGRGETCALSRCPHFRQGSCFVVRARRNAEGAHIIVVNHALLLSDLATSGGVLPEYSHLIVDEAHHLEREATDQLGYELSRADLERRLAAIHQVTSGQWQAGLLSELLGALREKEMAEEELANIKALVSSAVAQLRRCRDQAGVFFEGLSCFLQEQAGSRSRSYAPVRITSDVRCQPGWSEIEIRWSELASRLASLAGGLRRLAMLLEGMENNQVIEREGILAELSGFESYLQAVSLRGNEAVSEPDPNGIYWTTGAGLTEEAAIHAAPLHVGEALNGALFARKETVVLTSATLTAEGSFEYVRERLGINEAREVVVGSPFNYRQSTLLYLVQDTPEPAKPTYQRSVETTITELVEAMQGRTLVLFTSHAQLRQTSGTIRSRLEQQGILVLAHGVDGSRRRLLQAFKSSPRAVLMGTSSFWEGIDVVGEALSCLVIVKLPFAVPTDPIFEARSETFEEPFRQYSIPQTILRFKQGFGRLIRSRSDRGVVVILDSRVGSKFYGPSFIHSLPQCTTRRGLASHAAEAASGWLEKVSASGK